MIFSLTSPNDREELQEPKDSLEKLCGGRGSGLLWRHRFSHLGSGFGLLSRHRFFFFSDEASVFSRYIFFLISEVASVFSQEALFFGKLGAGFVLTRKGLRVN